MNSRVKIPQRLTGGIILIILLTIGLAVTTFALVYTTVAVDNNIFRTGNVDINLNDGKPIISEHEFIFEPGMTVYKDFFIQNLSSWDVYYKIYFEDVEGGLADTIEITIMDGDTALYTGTILELSRTGVSAADDELGVMERKTLTMYFHFPEDAGNAAQAQHLSFTVCADAVQTKNNPGRLFD